MQLKIGTKGLLSHRVKDSDLATNWANDVPVLATPILLWLAELACIRAIGDSLAPGKMSLGYAHDVQHLAPTPVGWIVQVEAEITSIEEKIVSFKVTASDGVDVVLSGTHRRALVDKARFVGKVEEKVDRFICERCKFPCPTGSCVGHSAAN